MCNEGFIGDGTNCKSRPKHEANFLLVNQGMATLRIPFAPTYEDPGSPIYIAYMQMAIAIDIDCMNGKAYSSDISGKIRFLPWGKIARINFSFFSFLFYEKYNNRE